MTTTKAAQRGKKYVLAAAGGGGTSTIAMASVTATIVRAAAVRSSVSPAVMPALPAVSWLSGLVQDTFDDTHGPISAFVYHQLGDGPVEPVARRRSDGALQIAVTEHFTAERVQGEGDEPG